MNQPVSLRDAPIGLIARLRLWLENYFGIHREGSTLRREIIAGATTFLEFPPARVLTGLLRRIDSAVKGSALNEPADFGESTAAMPA